MAARTGRALLAGVIGHPVTHSLSPALHEYWLRTYEIDGAYVPLGVAPGRLSDILSVLRELNFRGVNVTIPHKEQAFLLADVTDQLAGFTRAANTLWFSPEGKLSASNTDIFGFMENMKRQGSGNLQNKSALVIGAGGAARGVCIALQMLGCKAITLTNRTLDRAEALARYVRGSRSGSASIDVMPWEKRNEAMKSAQLLVNTSSLGMAGQPPLEVELSALPLDATVADIVYNPLRTGLIRSAEGRGLNVVDGLGMLLYQAVPGFEKWFGVKPEVTDGLRRHVAGLLG